MLKIGLIGVGYLGKIHFDLLRSSKDFHFSGFYEHDATRAGEFAQVATSFSDFSSLADASDALVIVSPTATHFDMASVCLAKGKHIFIEKPATATLEEGEKLLGLAKQYPHLKIQVGHVERFNPALAAVLPLVTAPQKIFCNRLAPFTLRGADVSVVFDVMIHDLDVVLHTVQSPVKNITAFGQKIVSQTTDVATATIEFENGTMAYFTASRHAERKYRTTEFYQDQKVYRVDYLNKTAAEYQLPAAMVQEKNFTGLSQLTHTDIPVTDYNAIGMELKTFADSIVNNKKVVVSLLDGVEAIRLASMIEDKMIE